MNKKDRFSRRLEGKQGKQVELYSLWWEENIDPVHREMLMCVNGGRWKKANGQMAGEGLFYHWKKGQELLWPEMKWHRWRELETKCYLDYKFIGEMGCAAAGKSDTSAANVLWDWYCFPNKTTVLISSTGLQELELRIFGMIKKYHKLARACKPWIPGNLIEGKRMITYDDRSESEEGRDFRNGIIGIACFLSGTLVDTPTGPKSIESLRIGDEVINAVGIGTITETHQRMADRAVRIHLSDGRTIDCTEEHPFFTQRGWVNARDLMTSDMVLSARETMRLLRRRFRTRISKSKVLFENLCTFFAQETLRSVRVRVSAVAGFWKPKSFWAFLQQDLCRSVGSRTQGMLQGRRREVQALRQKHGHGALLKRILLGRMSKPSRTPSLLMVRKVFHFDSGISNQAQIPFLQSILQSERDGTPEAHENRSADTPRIIGVEDVPEVDLELPSANWNKAKKWFGSLVQAGYRLSRYQIGRRNRRRSPPNSSGNAEGSASNKTDLGTRVDRVEVLESRGDPRFEESKGGYSVFNLAVTGHPSYSVNGVIVHNCKKGTQFVGLGAYVGIHNARVRMVGDELHMMPRAFLDSLSNLYKCPDFKMVGLGNPNETTNAHGFLCEPAAHLGGWEGGIDQTGGTKTWQTKMPHGICIQLPGPDSPNMDAPAGALPPFPFLITREQLETDAKIWGTNDWHYTMMNEARMPRGQGSRRFLTRQAAMKFGAMREPVWLNANRKKILFLDAAYRGIGGDRCIFGQLDFGDESTGLPTDPLTEALAAQRSDAQTRHQIMALIDIVAIPVSADRESDLPEDQIVKFVMEQAQLRGIGPENLYYDSGMRTSLVQAFSRLWSPRVNSIDFGGPASERKVSGDIDVLCKDYYSKFVTELWGSVRLVVESGQFRGMTEEVLYEFCAREWKAVSGNRMEAETKADMKLKCGRSPDLADAVAIGVEGARRMGFVIKRAQSENEFFVDTKWKSDLMRKVQDARSRHLLNHRA